MKLWSRQRGIGLVEVLVAVLLIGVAVAAISQFQGKMLKATSQTSHREVALKLVQAKMDDLRSYGITGDSGFAFDAIDTNQGGRSAQLQAGTLSFEQRTFDLDWAVTDYAYVNGSFVTPVPAGEKTARKQVVVNVRWQDVRTQPGSDGSPEPFVRVLSMTHYLAPTQSDTGTPSSGGGGEGVSGGPQVNYQEYLAPDVIDIDLGNGQKRETSKPIPDVDASDDIVMVQFDTVNFVSPDNDKVTQEDMVTVSCNCTKQAAQAESANPIQLEWTNDDSLFWTQPEPTTKPVGQAVQQGTSQLEDLCNRCCEGHFDEESGGSELATDRLESHYSYDKYRWGNIRYLSERLSDGSYRFTQAGGGQDYTEACRFMRVNGFYELMPDWQQVHFELMSRDYLEHSDHEVQYQGLVTDVLADFDNSSEFYQVNPGAYQFDYGVSSGAFPQQAVSLDTSTGNTQFIARGLYVDPIEAYRRENLSVPLASYPFYEVNSTLLSDWALYACNDANSTPGNGCTLCDADDEEYECPGRISLTNGRVGGSKKPVNDAEYYVGYYSRGKLVYPTSAEGYYRVEVSSRKSNSGLTGIGPISPYDEATTFASHIMVKLGEGSVTPPDEGEDPVEPPSTINVGGNIYCVKAKVKGGKFDAWEKCTGSLDVVVSIDGAQACSVTQPKNNNPGTFNCNVASSWQQGNGYLAFSASNAGFQPSIVTAAEVQATDDKQEFCITMVSGSIPNGADSLVGCALPEGPIWSAN